jgi:hypothetical protein
MPLSERDLALRWEKRPNGRIEADRAVIIGTSGCGKSTLATKLVQWWQEDFCDPRIPFKDRGRIAVLDEKPRYRATHAVTGKSIRKRYANFVRGDTIRGLVFDDPGAWPLVWDEHINPWQTVVAQTPEMPEDYAVWLCQGVVDRMYLTQKPTRPTLVYCDEGLSFFGPTGIGRHGSAIQRAYRAGREKGLASLLGSQRPKQINVQTLTEANVAYVFRLNSAADTKHLTDQMGLEPPPYLLAPRDRYVFWFYRDGLLQHPRPLMLPRSSAA